jgi:hypothetical protein
MQIMVDIELSLTKEELADLKQAAEYLEMSIGEAARYFIAKETKNVIRCYSLSS